MWKRQYMVWIVSCFVCFGLGYIVRQGDTTSVTPPPLPPAVSTVVRRNDAKTYPIPGGTCHLYPDAETGRLSCALVGVTGRYPEEGRRVNQTCTEGIFVIDGTITVEIDGIAHELQRHDVVYITPGTSYSITGSAMAFVFIEPRWVSAQNVPIP